MATQISYMEETVQSICTNSSFEDNISECGTKVIFKETVLFGQNFAIEWKQQRMLTQAHHFKWSFKKGRTSSPFQVKLSERRQDVTISNEPFGKEARVHHLKETVQHKCVRSQFKGNLSELNPKLAIIKNCQKWRHKPKVREEPFRMDAQAIHLNGTAQNRRKSLPFTNNLSKWTQGRHLKGNRSEQRQKLATLREPFRVEAKHHYLQEAVKNAGTYVHVKGKVLNGWTILPPEKKLSELR